MTTKPVLNNEYENYVRWAQSGDQSDPMNTVYALLAVANRLDLLIRTVESK